MLIMIYKKDALLVAPQPPNPLKPQPKKIPLRKKFAE